MRTYISILATLCCCCVCWPRSFAALPAQWSEGNAPVLPLRVLLAYGRCPLFFYIVHLWLIGGIAVGIHFLTGVDQVRCGMPLQCVATGSL